MQLTGAQILVETLCEQGVDTVFGYPGAVMLPVYDALYDRQDRIRHILTTHEQGAAHAADGYARASDRVGVCMATSGPGATNLVTGIAAAFLDSVPMVCITGQVPLTQIGTDSFQEVDTTGITQPITKHNVIVQRVEALAPILRQAFQLAQAGRPGPVLVDVPGDVLKAVGCYTPQTPVARTWTSRETLEAQQGKYLDRAADMLRKARRPAILVGGGVIRGQAAEALRQVAERLQAPVASTLMGLGAFPTTHPLYTGMLGLHGTLAANRVVARADVVLAVGTRFSDRGGGDEHRLSARAKVIHIDVDRAEISKNVLATLYLLGDARPILESLLPRLSPCGHPEWLEEARKAAAQETPSHPPLSRRILRTLGTRMGQGAIVTDVGQHQMATARTVAFERPGQFVTSGGLGAMGYGLGAAMGVALARPGRPVALVTGDGSFRMNCNELSTVAAYGLPIVVVIMNNGVLGMVRQYQKANYGGRYSQTTLDRGPDFVKLAEAYGLQGWRVDNEADFATVLDRALQEQRAAVIDCRLEPDEMTVVCNTAGEEAT